MFYYLNRPNTVAGLTKWFRAIFVKEIYQYGDSTHSLLPTGETVTKKTTAAGGENIAVKKPDGTTTTATSVVTGNDGAIDANLMPFTGLRFIDELTPNGTDLLTSLESGATAGDYYVVDSSGTIDYSKTYQPSIFYIFTAFVA